MQSECYFCDMSFKLWLESIMLEGFAEKRQQFIQKDRIAANIVDSYIDEFKLIKDRRYRQINDNIPDLTVPIANRKDIDAYPNFKQLEIFVDYIKGQVAIKNKKFTDIKTTAEPIFKNNNVEIFLAKNQEDCIEYKGKAGYTWCVSRNDSGNMYKTYRYGNDEPTFYFVKNIKRTEKEFEEPSTGRFKDNYHFYVIQVFASADLQDKNQEQYKITGANNDHDELISWNGITDKDPDLKDLQYIFKPLPVNQKEKEFYNRFKNGLSDEDYAKLNHEEKSVYIDITKNLSDEKFAATPVDLINKYIGLRIGLTDKQIDFIKNNKQLIKRYENVRLKYLDEMMKEYKWTVQNLPRKFDKELVINNLEKIDKKLNFNEVTMLLSEKENAVDFLKSKKQYFENRVTVADIVESKTLKGGKPSTYGQKQYKNLADAVDDTIQNIQKTNDLLGTKFYLDPVPQDTFYFFTFPNTSSRMEVDPIRIIEIMGRKKLNDYLQNPIDVKSDHPDDEDETHKYAGIYWLNAIKNILYNQKEAEKIQKLILDIMGTITEDQLVTLIMNTNFFNTNKPDVVLLKLLASHISPSINLNRLYEKIIENHISNGSYFVNSRLYFDEYKKNLKKFLSNISDNIRNLDYENEYEFIRTKLDKNTRPKKLKKEEYNGL